MASSSSSARRKAMMLRQMSDEFYQDGESEASELLEHLRELHRTTGRPFVDVSFGNGIKCAMPEQIASQRVEWRRPASVQYDGSAQVEDAAAWSLFGEDGQPQPGDVNQGNTRTVH